MMAAQPLAPDRVRQADYHHLREAQHLGLAERARDATVADIHRAMASRHAEAALAAEQP